jgi:hypothetical protein
MAAIYINKYWKLVNMENVQIWQRLSYTCNEWKINDNKKKKKTCAINYISNYSYYLSSIFFCDDFKSCLSLQKKMDKIFTNFLCMKSIRFQNSSVLMW